MSTALSRRPAARSDPGPPDHQCADVRDLLPAALGPGPALVREALHSRAAGGGTHLHGLRQALVAAVRGVHPGHRRRPDLRRGCGVHPVLGALLRLLVPALRHRHPPDRDALPGHRLDRRRRGHPVADRAASAPACCRPCARLRGRPDNDDGRDGRGLDTQLPPRPARHPAVRVHPQHGAGQRLRAAVREPDRLGLAPDPALVRPRVHLGRHLRPAHTRPDARRAERGLHPHRPRQGPRRGPGDRSARAAQRAHPGHHHLRPRPRRRCSAAR